MKQLYRAWDERHKDMVYIDDFYWFEENGIHEIGNEVVKVTTGDYLFMRYIGLNDKFGKNIYEDDVVELTYKLYPKRPAIRCIIMWLDYKACFRAVKSQNFIANIGNTDKYVTRVIGNLHQDIKLVDPTELTTWYPLNKRQLFFQSRLAKK